MKDAQPLDRETAETYAAWFRVLADGTRVQIVSLLARSGTPLSVKEIVAAVPVGQSTVSEHLRQLAAVGFVLAEERGTSRLYRINSDCVRCSCGLDMTKEMLDLAGASAREAGAQNAVFLRGQIEAIPLPGGSVDVIISNCVISLTRAGFTGISITATHQAGDGVHAAVIRAARP